MLLKNDLASLVAFSIALDESNDIEYNPQLAVFVCYVSRQFWINNELLGLITFMDTRNGVDIKNAINYVLSHCIPLNI